MDAGQVISLKIIVHIHFPVAVHHIIAPGMHFQLLEPVSGSLLRKFSQFRNQRFGVLIKVHENPSAPFLRTHPNQTKVLDATVLHAFKLRRIEQTTVKAARPPVISATKESPRATPFRGRSRTMSANIMEYPQLARLI